MISNALKRRVVFLFNYIIFSIRFIVVVIWVLLTFKEEDYPDIS